LWRRYMSRYVDDDDEDGNDVDDVVCVLMIDVAGCIAWMK